MHNGDGDTGYLAGLHPRGHLQILQDIDYRGRSVLTTFKQTGTLYMLLHITRSRSSRADGHWSMCYGHPYGLGSINDPLP